MFGPIQLQFPNELQQCLPRRLSTLSAQTTENANRDGKELLASFLNPKTTNSRKEAVLFSDQRVNLPKWTWTNRSSPSSTWTDLAIQRQHLSRELARTRTDTLQMAPALNGWRRSCCRKPHSARYNTVPRANHRITVISWGGPLAVLLGRFRFAGRNNRPG